MKGITSYLSLAALLAANIAVAQNDLKKEVVIDREVEPEVQQARRPTRVSPSVFMPKFEQIRLRPGEYTGTGELSRRISMLQPAAYRDSLPTSRRRGYLDLGYFPAFNLGASAGYRFIDTKTMRLGAWLQYDGESYNTSTSYMSRPVADGKTREKLTNHTATIGVDFANAFRMGTLSAGAKYTYASTTQPVFGDGYKQTVSEFGANARWQHQSQRLPWHFAVDVNHFGNDTDMPLNLAPGYDGGPGAKRVPAASETVFGFSGALVRNWTSHSWGVELGARFQHLNRQGLLWPAGRLVAADDQTEPVPEGCNLFLYDDAATNGVIKIAPYYELNRSAFSARLGLDIDFATGPENTTLLSPDISLVFKPTQQFAAWARVNGGIHLNTLASLFDRTLYLPSAYTYGHSKIVDATIGATFGPISGFEAKVWAGYSETDNWMMFACTEGINTMVPVDLKGFRYGASVAWQHRKLLRIEASAEGCGNGDIDKGYYLRDDHAAWVVNASATVTPVAPLDITLGWNLRTSRSYYDLTPNPISDFLPDDGSYGLGYWSAQRVNMRNVSSLSLGATYRFTSSFSAFVKAENLLCRRPLIAPQVQSQGLHGLVGISLSF